MSKFKLPIILVHTFFVLLSFNIPLHGTSPSSNYKIVGYVAGWKDWSKHPIEVEKMTHINYAFATLNADGTVKPARQNDSVNLTHIVSLKSRNKDLKVLISIGGWGADYFSNAALSDKSRKAFAQSAIAFMKKFDLDGIDIDWEYPGQIGGGNVYRAKDKKTFTLMLKELRGQLNALAATEVRKENYLLTIASGGDKEYLKHTQLGKAHQYLDFINIMTYDLYNGLDKETGHHTPLYKSRKGISNRNSSDEAVNGHIKAGVPVEKIVLGLAFYGRGWDKVCTINNGLFQPSAGKHLELSYDSLKSHYINKNGFKRFWDEDAKAPYLWNEEKEIFITYADEESFAAKVEYVRTRGLGGVMFWEYSLNMTDGVLLDQLSGELESSQHSQ